MSGLAPPSGLRIEGPLPAAYEPIDVEMDDLAIDPSQNAIEVKLDDGSIIVNLGGPQSAAKRDTSFNENIAEDLNETELGGIAEILLTGVENDKASYAEWLATRADSIEMLGFKVEKPGGDGNTGAGISRMRHPVLAEAVIRGQATARGELLPADGPVKVRNDDPNSSLQSDDLANALEKDMNHYLTTTATEYYPDTDRMLFMVYLGGCQFKKAYHHPLKKRPVSESVDAENLIVSNAATDIKSAARVTHRHFMRSSMLKRMQIVGAYRDVDLEAPQSDQKNIVDQAKETVAGVRHNQSNEPSDREYELYEVYCELDIPGYEHKGRDGKPDGLAVPYKVTVEKNTRIILEIRRNWVEGDELCLPKTCIVKFGYLPSIGFYDIGLGQILGSITNAITAGVREGLDAGMFANFPGFLYSKIGGKQNTLDIRVMPGQGAPVDSGGLPLNQAIMPLPYKEMGPGMMTLIKSLEETAMRLGGSASIQVGEGNANAPVGTTIALIEQATKPMDAVHKRLVQAQGEEIRLLVDLFREDPEAFYRGRKLPSRKPWNEAQFIEALRDYDLVPAADPNTSSSMQRIGKAQAVYQLGKDNPAAFNQHAVYQYVMKALGVGMPDQLLNTQPANQAPDIKAQADLLNAQAKNKDADAKLASVKVDEMDSLIDGENRKADRDARVEVAQINLQREMIESAGARQHDHQMTDKKIASDHALRDKDAQDERMRLMIDRAYQTEQENKGQPS